MTLGMARLGGALLKKKCVITGGTRGIGKAIVDRFYSEGADILVVARSAYSEGPGVETRSGGGTVTHLRGDVTKTDTWQDILHEVPYPDILVNCAGVSQRHLLATLSDSDVQNILNTNLVSTILGCRYAVKSMMRKKRGGCIINVSSVLARKGFEGTSVYAAAKAGILGLTSSLAVEYGSCNIRVNALVPGYVSTGMTENIDPGRIAKIPLGRFGTVDEIANAAKFLAENSYASNCILNIDGGLSAT